MSLQGKLLRGLKWHKHRNLDGVYHEDIANDPHKMEEVNFYLDFVKIRDKDKVHKILEKCMIFDLSNKMASMEKEAEKLKSDDLLLEPPEEGGE